MKRLLCVLCLFLILNGCQPSPSAQQTEETSQVEQVQSKKEVLTERYTLYKTENYHTFIKLDTQTGQLWQVHWGLEEGNDGIDVLSDMVLADTTKNGRFRLFSTVNMYNFILLDEIDGRVWQVQWSFKEKERFIEPIE